MSKDLTGTFDLTTNLVWLDELRNFVVRRYNAIVNEADEEVARLVAAGRP